MKNLIEIAFFTADVARMTDFYQKFLGVLPAAQSPSMAIFMLGDTKIFIHRNYESQEGELPPENHFAFAVEDVDAACQELVEAGLVIEVAPKDYYWGRSAYLRDPEGTLIELHKPE